MGIGYRVPDRAPLRSSVYADLRTQYQVPCTRYPVPKMYIQL